METLHKAQKGTPQYEEWLRKYREKRHGKGDEYEVKKVNAEEAKSVLEKESKSSGEKGRSSRVSYAKHSLERLDQRNEYTNALRFDDALRRIDDKYVGYRPQFTTVVSDSLSNISKVGDATPFINVGGYEFRIKTSEGKSTKDAYGNTVTRTVFTAEDKQGNEIGSIQIRHSYDKSSPDYSGKGGTYYGADKEWDRTKQEARASSRYAKVASAFYEDVLKNAKQHYLNNHPLEKATKGTPQYEEWLRKYREKRHGKGDAEEAKKVLKGKGSEELNTSKIKEEFQRSLNEIRKDYDDGYAEIPLENLGIPKEMDESKVTSLFGKLSEELSDDSNTVNIWLEKDKAVIYTEPDDMYEEFVHSDGRKGDI